MIARSSRIPSYRHHAARGLGVATFNGRDICFGPYDDPASRAAYDRALAEWLAHGRAVSFVDSSDDRATDRPVHPSRRREVPVKRAGEHPPPATAQTLADVG